MSIVPPFKLSPSSFGSAVTLTTPAGTPSLDITRLLSPRAVPRFDTSFAPVSLATIVLTRSRVAPDFVLDPRSAGFDDAADRRCAHAALRDRCVEDVGGAGIVDRTAKPAELRRIAQQVPGATEALLALNVSSAR